jgi:hypothetical protein
VPGSPRHAVQSSGSTRARQPLDHDACAGRDGSHAWCCARRIGAPAVRWAWHGYMAYMETDQPLEKTPDGHFVVIKGRKWRATDPSVPEEAAARLRRHLMSARRAVRSATTAGDERAERAARTRVNRAKVALGERGTPWWEQTEVERRRRWKQGLATLDAEAQGQGREGQ